MTDTTAGWPAEAPVKAPTLKIVVWSSTKTNVTNATKQLAKKTAEMAALGYVASAPIVVGQAGRNFARPHQVVITTTFTPAAS